MEGEEKEEKRKKKRGEKRTETYLTQGQEFIRAIKQCKITSESVHVLLFCCYIVTCLFCPQLFFVHWAQ